MNNNSQDNNSPGNQSLPGGKKGKLSLSKLKTFDSFKYPAYNIYFVAVGGNWAGQSMQNMTRSLLIFRLTESAAIIGIMALAQSLPAFFVSLWGGAVADRIPKKYILIVCRFATALVAVLTALALWFGIISADRPGSWWLLILVAALEGTLNSFMNPANISIIPEIVGEEHVMNAISLSSVGQNIFRLVSPVVAGVLIDQYSFSHVYVAIALVYIISAVLSFFLPLTRSDVVKKGSTWSNMIDALRYLKRDTVVMVIVVFALVHTVAGMPYSQLLPVFTETILKISATQLGVLQAISGVGSMLGAFVLASLPAKRRGLLLLVSGVIMGLPLVVFSFSANWYLSLIMMPLIGFGPTLHMAMTSTLIQTYVEKDFRGRMQALFSMSGGISSLGTFVAALLASTIGVQWSIGGLAIFLVIASIAFIGMVPGLRKMD